MENIVTILEILFWKELMILCDSLYIFFMCFIIVFTVYLIEYIFNSFIYIYIKLLNNKKVLFYYYL